MSAQGLTVTQIALINSRFNGIVRAMINTLLRTSRSAILNTARDFSCCIITNDDRMLAMAESLPIHVMSGPDLMSRFMKASFPRLKKGDAFINNSPYHGNSHPADWSVLVPVVDSYGDHLYTVLAKAHLADCGNSLPTTYSAGARDVYEEGALILPCVKVQEDYEHKEDILRMARVRIRVPDLWYGDFLALLGAARIAERQLLDLVAEIGAENLKEYEAAWFDYSERRMVAAIQAMRGGRATRTGTHDPVPGAPNGIEIRVSVDVDPAEARIVVDLRDNPDCLPCGLNLSEATARTAAMMGVFSSLGEVVPTNAGSFRRVEVHLRENCVVGIPRHPHSCSAATTNLSELTANCVSGAIAELSNGTHGLAEVGKAQPASCGVISGVDPRERGGAFVNQLMLGYSGGAGAPKADGWLTMLGIGAGGFLFRDSVEIDEMKYPILVEEQRIVTDSEGAGRYRGAPGIKVVYGPVAGAELDVLYLSDGTFNPARGVRGGGPALAAQQRIRHPDGSESEELGTYALVHLAPGEQMVSQCCGGGGYGPPAERDPFRVAADVKEGLVSAARATAVYGVVLDTDGDIDWQKTDALRRELTREESRVE